jgi:ribose transport system permease protein
LLVIAIAAGIFLRRTIWGRYLYALGNNEDGARYSGINTDAMKITAYVICSMLAGIAGILFAFELDSVQPAQTGEFYELYAIAAAVLGGCSLRGGEGSILGVVIAAAVIRLIYNSINMVGISTHLEFGILGMVILLGVLGDEMIKKAVTRRQLSKS